MESDDKERMERCRQVEELVRQQRVYPPPSVEETARLFDDCVRISEEASVALYSYGSAERLAGVTEELVRLLERWGVLGTKRDVLDLGCGIGRVARAIAPRVREVHAVDVSPGMIEAARRRCAGAANVSVVLGSGQDLSPWADARLDTILAIDSFPYIVAVGEPLVRGHLRESARVLRPGGELAIFNWSYRDDLERDRREARALAEEHGFQLLVSGARPLRLWDGAAFRLRRSAS
jgi:SAM-dependent methyltransferase